MWGGSTIRRLADLHLHALYGVDDGAADPAEMLAIVKTAYDAGARCLCFTPHYHPGYYGDNVRHSETVFARLQSDCAERYPDLRLYLGNELHYQKGARSWVEDGQCRTLAGTEYLLVDFSTMESGRQISDGLHRLLNAGYTPILAHAERYGTFFHSLGAIDNFRRDGILIQMDADSPLGGDGFWVKCQSRRMLKAGLVDLVCSDAHGAKKRTWQLDDCYDYLSKAFGARTADRLCCETAERILNGKLEE